jgi:hypothetical protein
LVETAVSALFTELHNFAASWPAQLTVLMPKVPDVTLFPSWREAQLNAPAVAAGGQGGGDDPTAKWQRLAILLTRRWNDLLAEQASKSAVMDVITFDSTAWLAGEMREVQMYSTSQQDRLGTGKSRPVFDNVSEPCIGSGLESTQDLNGEMVRRRCQDPKVWLWWDFWGLGPLANERFGKKVAGAVAEAKLWET